MCNFIFFKSFIRALKSFFFSVICWSAVGLTSEASSGCHVAFLTLVSMCTSNPSGSYYWYWLSVYWEPNLFYSCGKSASSTSFLPQPRSWTAEPRSGCGWDRFFFTRRSFSHIYGRVILICAEFFLWFYNSWHKSPKETDQSRAL